MEKRPSEIIEGFLTFLEESNKEYYECKEVINLCEKRNIDYLHDVEFAKDKLERNRIVTRIQKNQILRRKNKDKALLLEKITHFFEDKSNKAFIGQLRRLLKEQKDRETYIESDRSYNRRAGDDN